MIIHYLGVDIYSLPLLIKNAVIDSCLLVICAEGNKIGSLLSLAPSLWVGRISYSLYLWHWPVICNIRYMAGMAFCDEISFSLIEYAEIVLFSFTLAYLSWKYVEMPFRKLKWVSCKKVFIVFCGLIVLLMSAFIMIAWCPYVIPMNAMRKFGNEQVNSFFKEQINYTLSQLTSDKNVGKRYKKGDSCPPFLIIEDSHATAMTTGIPILSKGIQYDLFALCKHAHSLYNKDDDVLKIFK